MPHANRPADATADAIRHFVERFFELTTIPPRPRLATRSHLFAMEVGSGEEGVHLWRGAENPHFR